MVNLYNITAAEFEMMDDSRLLLVKLKFRRSFEAFSGVKKIEVVATSIKAFLVFHTLIHVSISRLHFLLS